jgi:hypothetical protein
MRASEPLRTGERTDTMSQAHKAAQLDAVLTRIASGAAIRDADPAFPKGPFRELAASGVLAMVAPELGDVGSERRVSFAEEWGALRDVPVGS